MSTVSDSERNANIQEWLWTEVIAERLRQDGKWGEQNHEDPYWLGIAVEEAGEVAKAVIEGDDEQLTTEIVQTMAVLCGWMEARNRGWCRGGVQACRVCGCTDLYGCDEGCWWVAEDLCSTCQGDHEAVTA